MGFLKSLGLEKLTANETWLICKLKAYFGGEMACERCGWDNNKTARFCAGCGTSLALETSELLPELEKILPLKNEAGGESNLSTQMEVDIAPAPDSTTRADKTQHPNNVELATKKRSRNTQSLFGLALVLILATAGTVALMDALQSHPRLQSAAPVRPLPKLAPQSSREVTSAASSTPTPTRHKTGKPSPTAPRDSKSRTSASPSPNPGASSEPTADDSTSYTLTESTACHAKVSAELQILKAGSWVFVANATGWKSIPNCPTTNPFRPYVTVDLNKNSTVRWRVYSPSWEWFSTAFTVN